MMREEERLHEPGRAWGRTQLMQESVGDPLPVPGGYRMVRIDTPSAGGLRDLASYRRDFELARSFLESYVADIEHEEGLSVPAMAMWMAAVTQYGRAFGTGVRHRDKPSLEIYSAEQLAHHRYFYDLRNKFVAHSVNSFEMVEVFAWITSSSFAPRRVSDIGQVHTGMGGLTAERASELIALCAVQIKDLNRRVKLAHRRLWSEVQELGLDAIYALPDVPALDADDSRVGRSRRQL